MKSSQQEVEKAIDGEIQYSFSKWDPSSTESGGEHSVAEWIIYIEDYLGEAKRVMSRQPEPDATTKAKHALRKIASMATIALMQNGVVTRQIEGARPVGASE